MDDASLRAAIAEMYRRITGRECSVDVFVVRKDSALGYYMVHPIPSGDFYLVNVKKLGSNG